MNYGVFVNAVVSFVIVAFALFLLIRSVNRMNQEEEASVSDPTTQACPRCLPTIAIKAARCPFCTSQLEPA